MAKKTKKGTPNRRFPWVWVLLCLIVAYLFLGSAGNSNEEPAKPKDQYVQIVRIWATFSAQCDSHDITIMGFSISGEVDRPKKGDIADLLKKKCDVPAPEIQNLYFFPMVTVKQGASTWEEDIDQKYFDRIQLKQICKMIEGKYLDLSTCKKNK